jgi:WD40 repeat protein/serine/threonine protein kinase
MKSDSRRSCLICGTLWAARAEFCPVCRLRSALDQGLETEAAGSETVLVPSRLELSTQRFEHYELVRDGNGNPVELGRGAMGISFKAVDTILGHAVALKVINADIAARPEARERFLREARAAARLRHPNVASVFYYGVRKSDGQCFYAMELVEGETLEARVRRAGRLSAALALDVVDQVSRALAAAEASGLVHRDLKPANLMLAAGPGLMVKVIDFGLAKGSNIASESDITQGGFVGTPAFASPEQFTGADVDVRSDLYSLGVTLWLMLTGQAPFRGAPAQLMHQHLHRALPLEELDHVTYPVISLVTTLLDKDPARRPQSASDLQTLLAKAIAALDLEKVESKSILGRAAKTQPEEVLHHVRFDRAGGSKQAAPPWDTRNRHWRLLAEPSLDFTPFLVAKLKGFTGRRWLFREIDQWLAKGSQPALLIVGEPGIGKSSIVAALVRENPNGQVLAYHWCRADTPATLEPARFVRDLSIKLSAKMEDYTALLADPVIGAALQFADADPASAFENAVLNPLHKIRPPGQGHCYLLIDALDEALTRSQRPTIVEVLSARIGFLPPWLRIVATTRSEPSVLRQLGSMRAHTLSAQDPRNQEDVRRFIQQRLGEPALRGMAQLSDKSLSTLEEDLVRTSKGNFLFITTVLDAVETGQLGFEQIGTLPPGLGSLYELFFDRLFRDAGVDFQPSRQVLETVAAAGEPLTREQIAAVTDLDADGELLPILARLTSFVPANDRRYSFFHLSLVDWLTNWDTRLDRPFAGPYHVNLKKGCARLADWYWTSYTRSPAKLPLYGLRHLLAHLHQLGRDDETRSALLDFDFLQAKLEATDVSELLTDYEYLPRDADLRLVQSSLRLSAHVLARDARQLAGQLTGRLLGSAAPAIKILLKQVAEKRNWPWLRPLHAGLTPAGSPLMTVLEGHRHEVTAVAVTPDGHRAVSGSVDRKLRLWELESGRTLLVFQGHGGAVKAVTVTPDGRRAVSGSDDRTVRIWDMESGHTQRTFEGHFDAVRAVAVAYDGRHVVSGSDDRTLRVWDLETGDPLRILEGHAAGITAVALTRDGRCAVSASYDRTLRVWDLEIGRTLRVLEGHTGALSAVAITPDGLSAVSASGDGTLRIWDLESGQAVGTLQDRGSYVAGVAITPDGRTAVSASYDGTLGVWDLESGQSVGTLHGHRSYVAAVAVTPKGRRAVSGSGDATLRVWDLAKSPSARVHEGHTLAIRAMAVTPNGRRVVSGSGDATLRVWDLESGQSVRKLEGHRSRVTAVAVTPDSRRAVSGSDDRTLRVWDLESGQTLRTLENHTSYVAAVAVTPDGRRAVSTSYDRTLRVWDLESGQTSCILAGHADAVRAVAITPDGGRAVSGSDDRTLRVWDLETGHPLRTFEGHTSYVAAVVITPDGRRAISGSWDQTLRVWDLEIGKTVRILKGHDGYVTALAVSRDGEYCVSASYDQTLRVWDLESGETITSFTGDGSLFCCAVASDGLTICAGDDLAQIHFLRLTGRNQA